MNSSDASEENMHSGAMENGGFAGAAEPEQQQQQQPQQPQQQASPRPAPPVLTRHPTATPSPPIVRQTKQPQRTYGRPPPGVVIPRALPPSRAQQVLQAAVGRGSPRPVTSPQQVLQQALVGRGSPRPAAQPQSQPHPQAQVGIPARRPSLPGHRPSHVDQPQHYVMTVPTSTEPAPTRMVAVQLSGGAPHQYRLVTQAATVARPTHGAQYSVVTHPAPADGALLLVDASAQQSGTLAMPARQDGMQYVMASTASGQSIEIPVQRANTVAGGGRGVMAQRGRPVVLGGARQPAPRGRPPGRGGPLPGRGPVLTAPPGQRPGEPPPHPPLQQTQSQPIPQPQMQQLAGVAVPAGIDITQIPIEFEEPAVTAARTQAAAAAVTAASSASAAPAPVAAPVHAPAQGQAPAPVQAPADAKPVTQTLVEYVSAGQTGQAEHMGAQPVRRKTISMEQYREMQKKKKQRTQSLDLPLQYVSSEAGQRYQAYGRGPAAQVVTGQLQGSAAGKQLAAVIDRTAVAQRKDSAPAAFAGGSVPKPVEPIASPLLPSKRALCPNCGQLSADLVRCDFCRKILGARARIVETVSPTSSPAASPAPSSAPAAGTVAAGTQAPLTTTVAVTAAGTAVAVTKPATEPQPIVLSLSPTTYSRVIAQHSRAAPRVIPGRPPPPPRQPRRVKRRLTEEPECLTISSDEESPPPARPSPAVTPSGDSGGPRAPGEDSGAGGDGSGRLSGEEPPSGAVLGGGKAATGSGAATPVEEEPVEECWQRDLLALAADGSLTGGYVSERPRAVRVGSYRPAIEQPVLFSEQGVQLRIPSVPSSPQPQRSVTVTLPPDRLQRVQAHFGTQMMVLFLYLTPASGVPVRRLLQMSDPGAVFFEPDSAVEAHKRVTFIFEEDLSEESRITLLQVFRNSIDPRRVVEINMAETNRILVLSSPAQISASLQTHQEHLVKTLLQFPPPPASGAIAVTTDDYCCLEEEQFLNDVIIDFYLKYLVSSRLAESDRRRTHVFSSFFYKRLTTRPSSRHGRRPAEDSLKMTPAEKRHARVKGWTKNVDIFDMDFLIVPINEHSHWFLAIICFPGLEGFQRLCDNQPCAPPEPRQSRAAAPPPPPAPPAAAAAAPTTVAGAPGAGPPSVMVTVPSQIGATHIVPIKVEGPEEVDDSDRDEAEGDDEDLDAEPEEGEDSRGATTAAAETAPGAAGEAKVTAAAGDAKGASEAKETMTAKAAAWEAKVGEAVIASSTAATAETTQQPQQQQQQQKQQSAAPVLEAALTAPANGETSSATTAAAAAAAAAATAAAAGASDAAAAPSETPAATATAAAADAVDGSSGDAKDGSTGDAKDTKDSAKDGSKEGSAENSEESEFELETPIPAVCTKDWPPTAVKQPCVLIFDSLAGASRTRVVATIRDYLRVEYSVKKGGQRPFSKDTIKGCCVKVPQQTNFSDCGVYVLQYVESFFQSPIQDFKVPLTPLPRWFPPERPQHKREQLAHLIERIARRQNPEHAASLPALIFNSAMARAAAAAGVEHPPPSPSPGREGRQRSGAQGVSTRQVVVARPAPGAPRQRVVGKAAGPGRQVHYMTLPPEGGPARPVQLVSLQAKPGRSMANSPTKLTLRPVGPVSPGTRQLAVAPRQLLVGNKPSPIRPPVKVTHRPGSATIIRQPVLQTTTVASPVVVAQRPVAATAGANAGTVAVKASVPVATQQTPVTAVRTVPAMSAELAPAPTSAEPNQVLPPDPGQELVPTLAQPQTELALMMSSRAGKPGRQLTIVRDTTGAAVAEMPVVTARPPLRPAVSAAGTPPPRSVSGAARTEPVVSRVKTVPAPAAANSPAAVSSPGPAQVNSPAAVTSPAAVNSPAPVASPAAVNSPAPAKSPAPVSTAAPSPVATAAPAPAATTAPTPAPVAAGVTHTRPAAAVSRPVAVSSPSPARSSPAPARPVRRSTITVSAAAAAAAARAGSLAMLADSYASDSSEQEEEEELPEAPELPELPEHPHNGGGAEGDSPARLARRGKQVPDYAMMVGIKRRLPIPGGAVREAKTPRKS